MEIQFAETLAVIGVAISTFNTGWNVYKHITEKGRLSLRCFVGKNIRDETNPHEKYLIWAVTNMGRFPVILEKIGGRETNGDFFITTGDELPKSLAPGEYYLGYSKDLAILSGSLKSLEAYDTVGKVYKCTRKNLKNLRKSMAKSEKPNSN